MAGCRQSLQRSASFSLVRFSPARARSRSRFSSTVRRTRFGFLGAFVFASLAGAGFEELGARVDFGFGFAGFLVLGLVSGSVS